MRALCHSDSQELGAGYDPRLFGEVEGIGLCTTDDVDGSETLAQRRKDFILARFGQIATGFGERGSSPLGDVLKRLVAGQRRRARIRPPPGNRGAQLVAD